jgi:hypothetical protein
MATAFQKDQVVRLNATIPQGPVQALRMLEDGTIQYLVSWTDDAGVAQERWFDEGQLTAA